MLRAGFRLLSFNLFYAILVWLTMYFPGVDLLASVFFIYLLFRWSRYLGDAGFNTWQVMGTAFLAQIPGLVFGSLAIYSWYLYGPLTSNHDFLLQMWHTPLVPILSLLPTIHLQGFPLSFLLLYVLSPVYIILMTLIAGLSTRPAGLDGYRPR
jgi:hypothetical protein